MKRFSLKPISLVLALCMASSCFAATVHAETDDSASHTSGTATTDKDKKPESEKNKKKPEEAYALPDAPSKKPDGYSGSWLWAEGDERFSLTLIEKDGKLTGFHSINRKSGSNVDTVSGRLLGDVDDNRSSIDYKIVGESDKLKDNSMEQHVTTRKSDVHIVSAGGDGSSPSINGEVHGPIVVVRFRSGQPGNVSYGHARLTVRGRYLYWQLMDKSGENYFPDDVVLVRQPEKSER